MNYERRTLLLIGFTALIKMFLGSTVELNNDEAHYWIYTHQLQWSYFDHPPMIALFIKIFTLNNYFHHEFFMRLPGVVTAVINTWIIFRIGKQLRDEVTGWIAVCLFTASIYGNIIAGLLILPDTPQLFFWLLSVWGFIDIIQKDKKDIPVNTRLLFVGVLLGLCILSKVHGVFLWAGFLGYVLFNKRSLLKNPYLYAAIGITLLMLVPSALWTMHNDFSTYNYHSNRIHFNHIQPNSFFREILGEIGYNNPVNWVLLVMALVGLKQSYEGLSLIKWLSIPLLFTVILLSIFNDTLPHWNGPAYVTLIPYTAVWLRMTKRSSYLPKVVKASVWVAASGLVLCAVIINYFPGTLGQKSLPELGNNDVTLDMSGWRQFSDSINTRIQNNNKPECIFSGFWFPGGHLAYYIGQPLRIPIRTVGSLSDIHHFAWTNKDLPEMRAGRDSWYITISNFMKDPPEKLKQYFDSCEALYTIPQYRSGKIVRYYYVYRLKNYHGGLPPNGIIF